MSQSKLPKSPPVPDIYLVIFYDLLGNGDELLSWSSPNDWKDNNDLASTMFFQSWKSIIEIRQSFEFVAKGLNDISIGDELAKYRKVLEKDALEQIDNLRRGTIRHQSFSDTNIWFLRIADDEIDGKCYCRAINGMMTGLSYSHLDSIRNGRFCRAGIDLGYGTNLCCLTGVDEIIGPVLLEAYLLERDVAKSARLVVGLNVIAAIDHRIDQIKTDQTDIESKSEWLVLQYELHFLSDVRSMFFEDDDGVFVLDYAGEMSAKAHSSVMKQHGIDPARFYSEVLRSVESQMHDLTESKQMKHLDRAEKLYRYLKSREQYWIPDE